jgi:hypothetical protein
MPIPDETLALWKQSVSSLAGEWSQEVILRLIDEVNDQRVQLAAARKELADRPVEVRYKDCDCGYCDEED